MAAWPAMATADDANVKAAGEALRMAQPARAAKLYGDALQSRSLTAIERARVLINRGLAYEQLGRREEAVADFSQAIGLKALGREDLARALHDRGVTQDEMGKSDAAINDYTAALAAVSDFPAALNNRANAYRRRGDLRNARADYEASLIKGNATPEYPLYGLGQIAEAEGNKAAALGFYQKAFAANPGFDLAVQRLAALQNERQHQNTAQSPSRSEAPPMRVTAQTVDHAPQNAVATLGSEVPLRQNIVEEPARKMRAGLGSHIQLGAYRSEGEAVDNWNRLVTASGDILGSLKPDIVKADIAGKGTYYRLRTGVPDGQDAGAFCRTLQARKLACIVVKG